MTAPHESVFDKMIEADAMLGPDYAEYLYSADDRLPFVSTTVHAEDQRAAGMWTAALMDCLIEDTPVCALTESPHYRAPVSINEVWFRALNQARKIEAMGKAA